MSSSIKMILEFSHGLCDVVNIKALKLEGRIVTIQVNSTGTQYEVRYFHESEHKFAWLYEDEIEEIKCRKQD